MYYSGHTNSGVKDSMFNLEGKCRSILLIVGGHTCSAVRLRLLLYQPRRKSVNGGGRTHDTCKICVILVARAQRCRSTAARGRAGLCSFRGRTCSCSYYSCPVVGRSLSDTTSANFCGVLSSLDALSKGLVLVWWRRLQQQSKYEMFCFG